MSRDEKTIKNWSRQYIAMKDRFAQLNGQPTLSSLLTSVQLPADLTDDTPKEYEAIQCGAGNMSEYSLKCLILLENNRIDQRQCNDLCEVFDAIAGLRWSSSNIVAPNGPANDPAW